MHLRELLKRWILLDSYALEIRTDNLQTLTAAGDLTIKNQAGSTIATFANGLTLTLANGGAIDEFSTDGTMAGNSDTAVPSEKAVVTYTAAEIAKIGGKRNLILNGCFRVHQEAATLTAATTPANNDDTYCSDQWILLSSANDVADVTHQTGGGVSGNDEYIRLDQETGGAVKFGIFQIIENKDLFEVIGDSVSLSFDAKCDAGLTDIRAVVLAWDGAADAVTSDIVSAWNAQGTRPTLVANWTAENVDSNLSVTTSWVRYSIENIDIDTASTTNIGVFIYCNSAGGLTDMLSITNVQLEQGANARAFKHRTLAEETELCMRYYEKSYAHNHYPGTGQTNGVVLFKSDGTGTDQPVQVHYHVKKRADASVTVYDSDNGTINKVRNETGGADATIDSITRDGTNGFGLLNFNAAPTNNSLYGFHWVADARL
jgi:hypothetical protein